jgi:hypothetical protein
MYTMYDTKKGNKYNNTVDSVNNYLKSQWCVQKKWVSVRVECAVGGKKMFPTLARFAEMLPGRGKGKTKIPSPQNRPIVPGHLQKLHQQNTIVVT